MALSEYEKKVLAEMEQHLRQQDPDLADTMASSLPETEPTPERPQSPPLSPRRIALGSILAAVGLAAVLLGVTIGTALWTIILGVVGFALMVFGVLLALSTDKNGRSQVKDDAAKPGKSPRRSKEERDAERRERWQNRG